MQSNGSLIVAESEGGGRMTRFSTDAPCARSIRFWWVTVSVALAFIGTSRTAECASAPNRVVIAYPSPTPRVAPLWLAQDLDFFGKYNLAAQLVLVRNNQMLAAGLGAGDIALTEIIDDKMSWEMPEELPRAEAAPKKRKRSS